MKNLLFTLLVFPACLHAQTITTIAGTGIAGYNGEGGQATAAELHSPNSIAFDKHGNLYIADGDNFRVCKISTSGILTTIAGNGGTSSSGDNGPAISAEVSPISIATDTFGNIYISETKRIRKINAVGIITTIAGDGTFGYNGDGIPATSAKVYEPYLGFVDGSGALYFSDHYNHRIRKIDATGIIYTIVGTGTSGSAGDSGPATAADIMSPCFLSENAKGELFIPDNGARRIRKVDTAGIITAFAGTGGGGNSGDGGPAIIATVATVNAAICDDSGNVYVASTSANKIRKVNAAGIITTIAGIGTLGYSGDNGPALTAEFNYANHVALYDGDIYVADMYNNRIRKISSKTLSVPDVSSTTGDILIYPNPAINEVAVSAGKPIEKILVTNISGQVVVSYRRTAGETKVSISTRDMPCGLYVVRINDIYVNRFVKE